MNADLRGLVAYAEGRVSHLNRGSCPDAIEGHESRDPDCPVCAALSVAQGQGWLPIESAPRDGTFYLATDGRECIVRNEPPGCLAGVWHKAKFDGWCGASHTGRLTITHWQPLPAAPAQPDGVE